MNDEDKIVAKIQKLLALAANNPNENEAEVAAQKAQQMLEEYNLDVSVIGRTAQGRPRRDQRQKGGLYGWQRNLWESVAELNFCRYWSVKGLTKGSTYEHRVLGSHANVVSTELMALYLQRAIDRLAKDWAKERGYNVFCRDAIAYREGMADRICDRLKAARADKVKAAKAKREDDEMRAKHPSSAPSGSLTIIDVMEDEESLNADYINGLEPGTTAARRREEEAKRAYAAAEFQRKQQQQAEWDLAHPKEAAERKAKDRAEWEAWLVKHAKAEERKAKKRKGSSGPRLRKATPKEERAELSAFSEGQRKGDEVSLDAQIDKTSNKEIG